MARLSAHEGMSPRQHRGNINRQTPCRSIISFNGEVTPQAPTAGPPFNEGRPLMTDHTEAVLHGVGARVPALSRTGR